MLTCYFSSKTRNTFRFVEKLDSKILEIEKGLVVSEPFLLVVPTYARADGTGAVHKTVIDFVKASMPYIRGVVGSGNVNFGKYFGYAANVVSSKCNVPILHKFELFGTERDVDIVNRKTRILAV